MGGTWCPKAQSHQYAPQAGRGRFGAFMVLNTVRRQRFEPVPRPANLPPQPFGERQGGLKALKRRRHGRDPRGRSPPPPPPRTAAVRDAACFSAGVNPAGPAPWGRAELRGWGILPGTGGVSLEQARGAALCWCHCTLPPHRPAGSSWAGRPSPSDRRAAASHGQPRPSWGDPTAPSPPCPGLGWAQPNGPAHSLL